MNAQPEKWVQIFMAVGFLASCSFFNLDVWFRPVFWYFLFVVGTLLALYLELIGKRLSVALRTVIAFALLSPALVLLVQTILY